MNPIALVTENVRFLNNASGRIGSAARRSAKHEERKQHDAEHRQHDHLDRPPGIRRPAQAREEHDRGQPPGQKRRTEVVDRVAFSLGAGVERERDHRERERAEREVDVEDPAPGEVVDEEAADQRPDHRRDAEDAAEVPLIAAPIPRRDDVADHRRRGHHQPAAAETLQRAEGDQRRHVLGDPAQRRADEEENDRRLQNHLAPVQIPELPVQRRHDRRRQQVRGDHPRQMLDAAEIADDRRQRRRDDRLIERRKQQHQKQRREDQTHTRLPLDRLARHRRGSRHGHRPTLRVQTEQLIIRSG